MNVEAPVIDLTRGSSTDVEPRGIKRSRSKHAHTNISTRNYRDASTSVTPSLDYIQMPESSSRAPIPHRIRHPSEDRLLTRPQPHPSDVVDLTSSDDELVSTPNTASFLPPRRQNLDSAPNRPQAELRPAQRQPRYDRQIINVDESPPGQRHIQRNSPGGSSHAHIASDDRFHVRPRSIEDRWRTRLLPPLPSTAPRPPENLIQFDRRTDALPTAPPNNGVSSVDPDTVIEIFDDPEDDVIIQFHRSRVNPPRPVPSTSRGAAMLSRLRTAALPTLDYAMQAFVLGPGAFEIQPPPPQLPPPSYDDLPPCPAGFTRSPREGDVLVCPSCDEELCVVDDDNNDGDKKGEIWVVKSCGHVYCGHCATGRAKKSPTKSRSLKNKMPAKEPFTHCRVKGCNEKVTGKQAMIQLFL